MIEKEHDPLSEKITFLGRTASGTTQVHIKHICRPMIAKQDPVHVTSHWARPYSYSTSTGIEKAISQLRNPVSLRLYKVLSPNFDDEDTRQALGTLSDLYATPKGKDILEVVEGVLMMKSWKILSMPHVSQRCWPGWFLENLQWKRENIFGGIWRTGWPWRKRKFLEALSEVDLVRSLFLSPQVDYILVITISTIITISSIRNSLNSRLM